jgi:hypothetical protein
MAKRKPAEPQWKTVELTAKVSPGHRDSDPITTAEMMATYDVSDRTLRNWAKLGCPTVKGPRGMTLYPVPGASDWSLGYMLLVAADRHGKGPTHLTVEQANDAHMARQMDEWPGDFVIVPLDWSHPMRETQLRRAAAGSEGEVLEEEYE